jgi:RING-variant domain
LEEWNHHDSLHEEDQDDDVSPEETPSMPPTEPYKDVQGTKTSSAQQEQPNIICRRTGLVYPSTKAFQLLQLYDDGIVFPNSTSLPPYHPTEQVFCRICREGLHENDADEELPAAAADNEAAPDPPASSTSSRRGSQNRLRNSSSGSSHRSNHPSNPSVSMNENDLDEDDVVYPSDPMVDAPMGATAITNSISAVTGPMLPHPTYSPNTDALQNPMLAPCECSGSMAFVHYLCVEQWRCRSRHPAAASGLNCETCGKPYCLPPPTERRVDTNQYGFFLNDQQQQDDWLDAMPPHVMQALRQPHIWWQMGAAVVRRRYLRPLAPVFMSPIVALYCRARRLLKKRGVARRRWACSLCRRRARWKCVRCLRSYYCSRQCQNVSWHIIHKHVCYKPIRMWSSVVVYGSLTLVTIPGILRDPLMYDIGICIIPASFVVMGILGGGFATVTKKWFGMDLRGRGMELAVVVGTIWFSVVSWGLVQGFFHARPNPTCYGVLGRIQATHQDLLFPMPWNAIMTSHNHTSTSAASYSSNLFSMVRLLQLYLLRMLRTLFFLPSQTIYLTWDRVFYHSWFRTILCATDSTSHMMTTMYNHSDDVSSTTTAAASASSLRTNRTGCFEHLPYADADFFLSSNTTTTTTTLDVGTYDPNIHASQCASDIVLVFSLYLLACCTLIWSIFYKQHERRQRQWIAQRQQQRIHNNNHHRLILGGEAVVGQQPQQQQQQQGYRLRPQQQQQAQQHLHQD